MRAKLALKTAEEAHKADYPLIVVDGSPDPKIRDELCTRGATVYREEKRGMGNSRRQCLNLGLKTGSDTIVWLEPEKWSMVPLLAESIKLVEDGTYQLIVPRRRTFENYPKYQHYSEVWANWEASHITGRPDLDLWVGPRIMCVDAVRLMTTYNGHLGDNWEVIFVPIITMLAKGWRIGSVLVDYIHPIEQQIEDDESMRQKRNKQRGDLLLAMRRRAAELGFLPKLVWP